MVGISGVLNSKIQAYGSSDGTSLTSENSYFTNQNTSSCIVPQWAIDIGHKDLYKEHHGCS